ncbi:uncharacterized protein LOC135930651 [Gordionus sp. m RMFG-2023]|uniref:uncharacterized protein LOC135930651 n=1 Tax=Gordionus sp. m RMFG-2023 TaxID=3053472 RepID=UPI0031FC6458
MDEYQSNFDLDEEYKSKKIEVGAQFESFNDLQEAIDKYENLVFTNYHIATCTKLGNFDENIIQTIQYKYIRYVCIHGGRHIKSRGKGKRLTQTLQLNFPNSFSVKHIIIGDLHRLEVSKMNSGHNHDLDYNLFMRLPKQRKINDESRSLIVKCLEYDASIPKIKYDLQQKGVYTTNRDLYNIKKKILYQPGDSELLDVFNLLKNLNPNNIIKIVSENNALHGYITKPQI